MSKTKKINYQRGAAHLFLVFVLVLGLIGALGFVGYNSWQRQQADAGGSGSVGSLQNKVKNIQAKIVKQGKAVNADQATFKEQRAITLGIGNWLKETDPEKLVPPTDAQELAYYNSAMAIKTAQAAFWKKFSEDKVNSPELVEAQKQRQTARKPLQEARALRDKAVDDLLALINNDREGTQRSASNAIDEARKRKEQAQKKVDQLKVAYEEASKPFLGIVFDWPEYVALLTARKELETAWDKRVELRDSIVEGKKKIRDLKVELREAKKALEKAKKQKQANQNNGGNNGGNNGNGGNNDQSGGKTCPSPSHLNSTGNACYYYAANGPTLECPNFKNAGKCYEGHIRTFDERLGQMVWTYVRPEKGTYHCEKGVPDGSKCVVITKTFN